jgi:hypothetical protein
MFDKPEYWLDSVKAGVFPRNSLLVETVLPLVQQRISLPALQDHGIEHVRRVCLYAEILAHTYGADPFAAVLAAYCHDAGRGQDGSDHDHGKQSWVMCSSIIVELVEPARVGSVELAITGHTDGRVCEDPLVAALWDADRIDLIRFGRPPVLEKLDARRFSRPEALRLAELLLPVDLGFARTLD